MPTQSVQSSSYSWDRCNDLLNSCSDAFSEKVVIPGIKNTYLAVGQGIANGAGLFSDYLKDRIAESWTDPFSSRFILWITKPIEHISFFVGTHKAAKWGPFHYLDTSLTSTAQHLYAYFKEVNYILSLPTTLKEYSATLSFDRFIYKLSAFFGKSFVVISKAIEVTKYVALKLLDLVIDVVDLVISFFTFTPEYQLLAYLREIVKDAIDKIHLSFVDIAAQAIDKTETRYRKKVVVEIANYATDFIVSTLNRAALKSLLGLGVYFGAHYALGSTFNASTIRAVGCLALGEVLLKGVVEPFLDPYYQAYNKDFDPNRSYLFKFLKRNSMIYLYPALSVVQQYIKG